MTLIITELSRYGIAMAADSAVTFREETPSGVTLTRLFTGVRKLQFILRLHAGISWWGNSQLPGRATLITTDVWLFDFIQRHGTVKSIHDLAEQLADELQEAVGDIREPLGFHLAGYVVQEGQTLPTFYHVRNVDGPYGNYTFHEFRLGHDFPPQEIDENRRPPLWRNGDFGPYAILSEAVEGVLPVIKTSMGLDIPQPSLPGRIAYLEAWIRFIADLHANSQIVPTIAGTVSSLGIAPDGEVHRSNVVIS